MIWSGGEIIIGHLVIIGSDQQLIILRWSHDDNPIKGKAGLDPLPASRITYKLHHSSFGIIITIIVIIFVMIRKREMMVIVNGFVDNLDDDKAQMIFLMTTISMLIAAMVEHFGGKMMIRDGGKDLLCFKPTRCSTFPCFLRIKLCWSSRWSSSSSFEKNTFKVIIIIIITIIIINHCHHQVEIGTFGQFEDWTRMQNSFNSYFVTNAILMIITCESVNIEELNRRNSTWHPCEGS